MALGLDFAWSRPGTDAILAGGFSFVLRYHSYDRTGKNLTRKEADTYRANSIAVVSNWEYATDAALNGYDQGVADAQAAQQQHLDCGGDGIAPIYFSADWDASEGQQGAIDSYLRGCADVIGASRVGVYGSYWVVKRCLDNGTAAWGWQTYAWSGGLWDDRAAVRQVQNGVQVGGADCDINTTDRANFGQWGAGAVDSSQPGDEGDEMNYQLRRLSDGDNVGMEIFLAGTTWFHVPTPEDRAAIQRLWPNIGEPQALDAVDLPACGVQVPFPAALGGGAPGLVDASAVAAALAADPAFAAGLRDLVATSVATAVDGLAGAILRKLHLTQAPDAP